MARALPPSVDQAVLIRGVFALGAAVAVAAPCAVVVGVLAAWSVGGIVVGLVFALSR